MYLNYLTAYQSKFHGNANVMFKVLETELQMGEVKDLDARIQKIKAIYSGSNEAFNNNVMWLQYLDARQKLTKIKYNTQKRVALLRQLRALAVKLAVKPMSPDQLKFIAQDALAHGQAPLALQIYKHLLQTQQLHQLQEFNQGALVAMQNNQPKISAIFYQKAYENAVGIEEQTEYALKTMTAWWSANQVQQALLFGLHLPAKLQNQTKVRYEIVRVALASNQPATAEKYLYQELNIPSDNLQGFQDRLVDIPFDSKVSNLLYDTTLYNKHLKEAYMIAQWGIKHAPQSLIWHQRLAQVALWNNHYNQAVQEWLYLFNHAKQEKIRKQAVDMMQSLGFDSVLCTMLETELKKTPQNLKIVIALAKARNSLGEPKQALKLLDSYLNNKRLYIAKNENLLRQAYALKGNIYKDMGQWNKAIAVYQERSQLLGDDAEGALAEARMYYEKRDLANAEASLRRVMFKVPPKNRDFWSTLAELAWATNDRKAALLAYHHYQDPPSSLIQLIELNRVSAPQKALQISLDAFKHYPTDLFLGNVLTFASAQNDTPAFLALLSLLSNKTRGIAEKIPVYWQMLGKLYGNQKQFNQQEALLWYAIQRDPLLAPLKQDLFWLALAQGKSAVVKVLLSLWYPQALSDMPALWYPMAEGLNLENAINASLALYQHYLTAAAATADPHCRCAKNTLDEETYLQMLLDYGNLLTKNHQNKSAYIVRDSSWSWVLEHLQDIENPLITHQVLEQLATYFASGTTQWWLNLGLLNHVESDQSLSLAMNWFLQNQMIDWILWTKNTYPQVLVPDRIRLSVALAQNDTQTLQDIQAKPLQTKPRTEHIQAAIRLENTAAAETLAYEEMRERPEAYETYKEFVPLALLDANHAGAWGEEESFINIAGMRAKAEVRQRLTRTWAMTTYGSNWFVKSQDPTQIINVPEDKRVGFKLQQKIHRGQVVYDVQYRDALNQFVPAEAEMTYQLSARWQTILNIGVNQENYQTSYMRIGGVQDQVTAKLIGQLDKYTLLYTEAEGINYYSQNRHYLGDGLGLHGSLAYKFWLTYPDYTVGAFTDLYFLRRNGSFSGDTLTLFPALSPLVTSNPTQLALAQDLQYQQLIPNSYYQGGVQFSFGDRVQEYSSCLRPYFLGRLYYNTLTRLSNEVKLGVNTTVFGRDSLLIYVEHGTAPAIAAASTSKIGARYVIYF